MQIVYVQPHMCQLLITNVLKYVKISNKSDFQRRLTFNEEFWKKLLNIFQLKALEITRKLFYLTVQEHLEFIFSVSFLLTTKYKVQRYAVVH